MTHRVTDSNARLKRLIVRLDPERRARFKRPFKTGDGAWVALALPAAPNTENPRNTQISTDRLRVLVQSPNPRTPGPPQPDPVAPWPALPPYYCHSPTQHYAYCHKLCGPALEPQGIRHSSTAPTRRNCAFPTILRCSTAAARQASGPGESPTRTHLGRHGCARPGVTVTR